MKESRTKKVQRNIFFSLTTFAVSFLTGYVSRIIFLKILDASYLGINGLFSNILGILSLADLGIGTAMMYSLYAPIAQNDTAKISSLIAFFRKIYLTIAAIVLGLGLSLLPFLEHLINLENPIEHVHWYYVLALLNTVISYLFVYRTTLITADQKNYVISKYTIGIKLFTFIGQTTILVLTHNFFAYLLTALIISFLGNLVLNQVAKRMYPFLKQQAESLEKEERKSIFDNVKSLFIYKISIIIQSHTDNILISLMVGTIYVGYYSNYLIVSTILVQLFGLVFMSVKASVGNLMSTDVNVKDKKQIYDILEFFSWVLVTFCCVCSAVLYQDFIIISFGSEYQLSFAIMFAIVVNFYTSNIRQTIWTFREALGLFHETRHITVVTSSLNLILSIIAGKIWGLAGILWATVVAKILYAWWREPMILYRRAFNTGCSQYLKTYMLRLAITIGIYLITNYLCTQICMDNSYAEFFVRAVVCSIIVILMILLFSFQTTEFQWCWKKFCEPLLVRIKRK